MPKEEGKGQVSGIQRVKTRGFVKHPIMQASQFTKEERKALFSYASLKIMKLNHDCIYINTLVQEHALTIIFKV